MTFYNEENQCTTLMQCLIFTINLGIRSTGGIGDKMDYLNLYGETYKYILRVFYDMFNHWLLNILFLNLILGIIIDAFASIRHEKQKIEIDLKTKCYICNLDKYIFEKSGEGFQTHIENDHKIWNYIYYIYYLMEKDPTEYTGIESEIASKIKQENNDWFPINKALCLEEEDDNEVSSQEIILEKLSLTKSSLQQLKDRFKIKEQQQLQKEAYENFSVDYHGSNFYEGNELDNSILNKTMNFN